jgi:hypothetical protein
VRALLILGALCSLAPSAWSAPTADEARFSQCQAKMKKAKELDLLYDLTWERGSAPRVLVGRTFFTIPIDAKEGFAEQLNCFLVAGQPGKCMNFTLRDWRTGKPVARFENCRLKVD